MAPGYGYGGLITQGVVNTISAIGAFGITKHNNATLQAQANIARINANVLMSQYEATLRAGESQIAKITAAAGQTKARQRTALAANGVAVGEGSAVELQASTDIIKQADVKTVEGNALREAWGYRMQAVNYKSQATMLESQKQSPWLTAGVTLLGGASQGTTSWAMNYLAQQGGTTGGTTNDEMKRFITNYGGYF